MVKMTKLDSAGQAQQYYKTEFSSSQQKYFSDNQAVSGQWSGKLAEEWGLEGQVTEEQFARLTEGQHPVTGERLVRNVEPHSFTNACRRNDHNQRPCAGLGYHVFGAEEYLRAGDLRRK